ncbi:flagellar biosynthesis protein [Aquariibacter albus]|uniref:Flagellar biosynthesis protein n=1 Tax=Aquariibacter albus TaxID=2759899 RepID=A0A839HFA8_9BURK|nr:flagellar biosynthesis protein [Aquariibacter albus]MBB1160607.1 flagellar biosynthesis protein [Aquariibacter albus]
MSASARLPEDQAAGLRRRFATPTLRILPVIANPALAWGGLLLERLASAAARLDRRTLVVDAGLHAREPDALARFDLAAAIEPLDSHLAYLAARGLPQQHVDAGGSTEAFLDALAEAAPEAELILLHAPAADLARLFGRAVRDGRAPQLRPLVLCDDSSATLTEAYAALKLLALRAGLRTHELLLAAPAGSRLAPRIAASLARCADGFLGGVQQHWLSVDPAEPPEQPPAAALVQRLDALLACAYAQPVGEAPRPRADRPGHAALAPLPALAREAGRARAAAPSSAMR